jgi:HSP20 family protein
MTDEKKEKEKKELAPRDYWMYDTIAEMRRMLDSVRSNMDEMFGRMPWPTWRPWRPTTPSAYREPYADVIDTGTELKVVVELPGVVKEDVTINATSDTLEISAETKTEKEAKEGEYVYRERGYASFKRMLTLPAEVIPEKTEAMFNNGVLEVVLPKKEPTPAEKKVKVGIK